MENKNFEAKQHYVSCEQLIKSTPEKFFPLLCPKREYKWIDGWKCNIIFPKSGFAELGCIFETEFPGELKETWVVDRYEKNKLIQFIRFCPIKVIKFTISLTDNNNGTTTAKWEQTLTSLNEEGNLYLEKFSDAGFVKVVKIREEMLNHFLETGEMLKMG